MLREPPFAIDVQTPLGLRFRCSATREQIETVKHLPMRGRLDEVIRTLAEPDEVRRSVSDPAVLLFYWRFAPRWICAVAVRIEGEGFLITAYPTDKVKLGDVLWTN